MNTGVNCIGCTRDEMLRRHLGGWLGDRYAFAWAEDVDAVALSVQQHSATVLLLDLRLPQAFNLLEWLPKGRPSCVTICFAEARSRPALLAEQLGVTDIQPFEPERKSVQAAVHRAAEMSKLRADNAILGARPSPPPQGRSVEAAPGISDDSFLDLTRAAQCLDDPDALLQHAVETVSRTAHCSRTALFLIGDSNEIFSLRAEVGPTGAISAFPATSPFTRWIRLHGRIIARSILFRIQSRDERLMLAQTLDDLKAEAVIPLAGKKGLIGWIAVGGPVSGAEIETPELEKLMRIGQKIASPIEKSQAFRNFGLRQRLVKMLFDALPMGVVALNSYLEVLWLNRAAEALLEVAFDGVAGLPIDNIVPGLRELAHASRAEGRTLNQVFRTPSGVPLEVRTESLAHDDDGSNPDVGHGFLIMLQDATASEDLREQREHSYRREILSEMAASIAFEIRSPLATIKTFTQLFPERATDPSFARRYQEVVAREVDRLSELSNSMCTLSSFRSQETGGPKPVFSIPNLLDLVRCLAGAEWSNVEPHVETDLPSIEGNCARLAECICHLLANAREATRNQPPAPIRLAVAKVNVTKNVSALAISVSDQRIIEKVGPFVDNSHLGSQDDHQRADLRLAFASEIVREFAGDISLATVENGVTIKLLLPIC